MMDSLDTVANSPPLFPPLRAHHPPSNATLNMTLAQQQSTLGLSG